MYTGKINEEKAAILNLSEKVGRKTFNKSICKYNEFYFMYKIFSSVLCTLFNVTFVLYINTKQKNEAAKKKIGVCGERTLNQLISRNTPLRFFNYYEWKRFMRKR